MVFFGVFRHVRKISQNGDNPGFPGVSLLSACREFREPLCYLGVSAFGDVLVSQRHLRVGVSEPVHEFCCGGTGLGGQHCTDVP